MIYAVLYVVMALIVGRIVHNVFVTYHYNKLIDKFDNWDVKYYGKGAGKEQAVLNKIRSYGDAIFPGVMLGVFWPIGILFLLGVLIKKYFNLRLPNFTKAKPYRDLNAKQIRENKEREAKELEARRDEEWQNLIKQAESLGLDVDVLKKL